MPTRIPVFMYLTDYRERCLKDVITQLEPGLFKKVTGLDVEDFNMLCSLGVFNAPLMNDAIFKFKRYEDASLVYTGIDKHKHDEVGGWDTSIRRAEYEKMFHNQQSSMKDTSLHAYKNESEDANRATPPKQNGRPGSKVFANNTANSSQSHNLDMLQGDVPTPETDVEGLGTSVSVGTIVKHRKFGKGEVANIDSSRKYIHIRFTVGEKKFLFPDAFLQGFLEVVSE